MTQWSCDTHSNLILTYMYTASLVPLLLHGMYPSCIERDTLCILFSPTVLILNVLNSVRRCISLQSFPPPCCRFLLMFLFMFSYQKAFTTASTHSNHQKPNTSSDDFLQQYMQSCTWFYRNVESQTSSPWLNNNTREIKRKCRQADGKWKKGQSGVIWTLERTNVHLSKSSKRSQVLLFLRHPCNKSLSPWSPFQKALHNNFYRIKCV